MKEEGTGRHVAQALFSLLLRQVFFVCELIYSGQTAHQRANDGAERRNDELDLWISANTS